MRRRFHFYENFTHKHNERIPQNRERFSLEEDEMKKKGFQVGFIFLKNFGFLLEKIEGKKQGGKQHPFFLEFEITQF